MTITKLKDGDAVTLQVDGRVDTNTSSELQKAILEAFQSAKKLTLDLEKVVYVSSAGLRALLLGQKIVVMHPDSTICGFDLTNLPYPRDPDSPRLRQLKEQITAQCRMATAN